MVRNWKLPTDPASSNIRERLTITQNPATVEIEGIVFVKKNPVLRIDDDIRCHVKMRYLNAKVFYTKLCGFSVGGGKPEIRARDHELNHVLFTDCNLETDLVADPENTANCQKYLPYVKKVGQPNSIRNSDGSCNRYWQIGPDSKADALLELEDRRYHPLGP